AVLVEVLTDNRNRTGSEIKTIFNRSGGSLAEPGAVSWQFERRGVVLVPGSASEDDVMLAALDAGADDVVDDGGSWRVTCEPSALGDVRTALEEAGMAIETAEVSMIPSTVIALDTAEAAKSVLNVMDTLDDHDDVQAVHANFDIPESVLEIGRASCRERRQ